MRALYIFLFLFIAIYSYAEIPEGVCQRINYQSTDCQEYLHKDTLDDMKVELDYLRTKHSLELARQGIFETPQQPIIIQQRPDEGVIVKTYFEESE